MEETNIQSQAAEALTEKPAVIEIVYKNPSLLRAVIISLSSRWSWFRQMLLRYGQHAEKQVYNLKPLTVGNFYRVAGAVRQIPDDLMQLTMSQFLMGACYENLDRIIYIVAVGLQNNRHEPSAKLLQLIRDEFTIGEIADLLSIVMHQSLNTAGFMKSIILIKGADLLRMSPTESAEIIAPQTPGQ